MSTPNVIELDDIIEAWAKDNFLGNATKKERKLFNNQLINTQIDWKRVGVQADEETQYVPPPPAPGQGPTKPSVLFQTEYANSTEQPQTYNLKASRATRSQCQVMIENTFTKGYDFGIKLSTPENILEANAGFRKEISVTSASGTTVEEELTWGIESEIAVPPRHKTLASVKVEEEEYEGKFRYETRFKGKVKVNYYNLKTSNTFIKSREQDLYEILRDAIKDKLVKPSQDSLYIDETSRSVVCVTTGRCRFKYGVRQRVHVEHEKLS